MLYGIPAWLEIILSFWTFFFVWLPLPIIAIIGSGTLHQNTWSQLFKVYVVLLLEVKWGFFVFLGCNWIIFTWNHFSYFIYTLSYMSVYGFGCLCSIVFWHLYLNSISTLCILALYKIIAISQKAFRSYTHWLMLILHTFSLSCQS